MKIALNDLAAAIESAMSDYVENDGAFTCHNPCLYVDPDADECEVEYGSALESPGCVVLWDLQEGLGSWTPEAGDDLTSIARSCAEQCLSEMQDVLDEKLADLA